VRSLKNETAAARNSRFDLRRALVVLQVAVSLLLLIGAGLFVRSLSNLESLDPGFRRDRVLLVSINPQASGYQGQRLRDYYQRLLSKVSAWPEVRSASLANITPLEGSRWNSDIGIEGYEWKPNEKPYLDFNSVGPRFFESFGIPMLAGRDFRDEDSPVTTPEPKAKPDPKDPAKIVGPRVMIVNESFVKRFFGNRSPLGTHVSREDTKYHAESAYEIIGVVKDAKYFGVREATEPMVYVPVWRDGAGQRSLVVRTQSDPKRMIAVIRREVAAIDSSIPVLNTLTMADQFDNNIVQERMLTTLCGFFGALAVLLAAVGLYGVMAHSVTRRVREIGIRMALGARGGEVLWLVLREVTWMVGIGALLGLPAAFALTRLVGSYLYGLTPQDPLSIAGSVLLLLAITAIAGLVPARRATRIDPIVALRYD
jgi:predicted permease